MICTEAAVPKSSSHFDQSKCDFEVNITVETSKHQNEIPFLYALKDLLCVHCLTSSSSVVNKQFIPCLLLSKHYPDGYPAKVVVNKDGIHMTGRSQPVSNSLLISWNCILRWQQMRLSTSSSVFRVYIVGLVHPCTPDDPEASNILLINQKLKIKDEDTNVKIPAGHSFKIDGFAHDASLDFCCLIISLDNRSDCDAISTAFQNYALCDSKDRVQRPLLLFVNKVSGQARAEKILFEFAGPLLSFSGCTFDVVNTGMSNILLSICIVYLHSRQLLGANSLFIPKA
ncbi:unnamed protein product, partial [Hymenolepis diminuta]